MPIGDRFKNIGSNVRVGYPVFLFCIGLAGGGPGGGGGLNEQFDECVRVFWCKM